MHLVDAAEILQSKAREVLVFVQGHGVMKNKLMSEARRRGLRNMLFEGVVGIERAAAVMAASDLLLVPLARVSIAAQFVPSKLFDSMAVGRPVLLSVEGEALRILEEAQAGLGYAPEDGDALATSVLDLRAAPLRVREMGERGRAFVTAGYLRNDLSDRMVNFIAQIAGETTPDHLASRAATA
jgi:glycosyltransferase involved in cell wall biosynthesis